jgi:hypothetical protein
MPRRRGCWLSTVALGGEAEMRPPWGFGEWPFRIFRHVDRLNYFYDILYLIAKDAIELFWGWMLT